MHKKVMLILFLATFFTAITCFCAGAECLHDFTPSYGNRNLINNSDMTHSYYCIRECGAYGTVRDGVNGKEDCVFEIIYSKAPDCDSEGSLIYACGICYRNKVETIERTPHTYRKVCQFSTCTQGGYDLYICTGCGYSFKDNLKEPSEHISDGGIVELLPTYDSDGVICSSCRVCGTVLGKRKLGRFEKKEPVKPDRIRGLTASNVTASSVKLTWDECDNAVYSLRYSTDKRKWHTLTVNAPHYTIKNLKPAQVYYFKAAAVLEGTAGEESDVISVATLPSGVVLSKVKSDRKGTATLKWKKVANVSNYEISYTADSFSKKKTVKTVTVKNKKSHTLKKLKSGKKYRFRIRACKKIGSVRIFGAYSKTRSIKIK